MNNINEWISVETKMTVLAIVLMVLIVGIAVIFLRTKIRRWLFSFGFTFGLMTLTGAGMPQGMADCFCLIMVFFMCSLIAYIVDWAIT
jgi:hypothetical protein